MIRFSRHVTYNDGVVSLMEATPERLTEGLDFSTTTGLSERVRMAFRLMSRREQDVALADSQGFELSLKVRVRRTSLVDPSLTACIEGRVYEISYIDRDTTDSYLYLTEISTDGTADLITQNTTYDADMVPHATDDAPVTVHVRKVSHGDVARTSDDVSALRPVASLVLRRCDWSGQEICIRDGVRYDVSKVTGDGEWVRLDCTQANATAGV